MIKSESKIQLQLFAGKDKVALPDNIHISPVAIFLFCVIYLALVIASIIMSNNGGSDNAIGIMFAVVTVVAFYILFALKVAHQWEKAVVLRLGKFHGLRGPGMFWIIPIIDSTTNWIDHRVMVTPFNAEKTLTKDTVPVDVDAVLFWVIWDAEKAALEVEDYRAAISWAAQTALREIIGQMTLADILVGPRQDGRRPAEDHRRAHHPLGHLRAVGGNPRRDHPAGPGRRHVAARRRPNANARRG